MVNIYGFSCFHFTIVLESGFLDPGHYLYRRLIFIMPFLKPSSIPDFLLWSFFSYSNPTFFLSSDSIFSTKIAPKLRKQFWSMTLHQSHGQGVTLAQPGTWPHTSLVHKFTDVDMCKATTIIINIVYACFCKGVQIIYIYIYCGECTLTAHMCLCNIVWSSTSVPKYGKLRAITLC